MLLFKSAYNDMYVKDISNKIRASLNIKKRNGEFVGAYPPYGYQKSIKDRHQLVIDEEAAVVVRKIFRLFITGNSISKIAFLLTNEKIKIPSIHQKMNRGLKSSLFGIWTNRTITDILTNPTYQGDLTQGRSRKINYKSKKRIHTKEKDWIICKNSCPVIVSKEIFALAQALYQANKNQFKILHSNSLLLKGLVYCKECNHKIGFRKVNSKKRNGIETIHFYGNCNYYLKKRKYQACTPHSVKYLELEKIILELVTNISSSIDKEFLLKELEIREREYNPLINLENDKKRQMKDIALEQKKLDNLYEDKLSEFITKERYIQLEKQIQMKIHQLQEKINDIKEKEKQVTKIRYQDYVEPIWKDYIKSRIFIAEIIQKILISEDKKIEVYFNIKSP